MDLMVGGSYVEPESTCITPLPIIRRYLTKWEGRTNLGDNDIIRMKLVDESS
jgi:hypothetical protein